MKFVKLKKEKLAITKAIFFSLLVHCAAGMFLLSCLSTDSVSSPELNGIKLVWMSLDSKQDMRKVEINNNRSYRTTSFKEVIAKEQVHMETPSANPGNIPISTVKTANTINLSPSVNMDASGGADRKEKFYSLSEINRKETAADNSNSHTVIAYPLYKENSPPVYPEIARVRGYEGIVLVSAEILPNGRVGEVKIRKSSGYAILDQSAIQAVKPWKFEPAKKSGNPFTAWVELPIKFILNSNSQS
jgi:TonB family protein